MPTRLELGWVWGGVDPRGPQARPKQASYPTGTSPPPAPNAGPRTHREAEA